MPVLTAYFLRRIGGAIALLWLALTLLIATLQLIAGWDDRAFAAAALLALLQMPRLAIETLPFACAIGAAASLQRMQENRELQTMWSAGLSLAHTALFLAGGGVLYAVATVVAGEILLEPSASLARAVKNEPAAKGNVWLHHQGVFLHAQTIAPDGTMHDVAIYEPNKNSLRLLTAKTAAQNDDIWRLTDGQESELHATDIKTREFAVREWHFPVPVAALRAIVRRPREMSMRTLSAAADGLQHGGGGERFAVAWWRRLTMIVALPMLAACAICGIGMRRKITVAVLFATGVVGVYYFSTAVFSQLALLLNLPPFAAVPLLLLSAAIAAGIQRRFT